MPRKQTLNFQAKCWRLASHPQFWSIRPSLDCEDRRISVGIGSWLHNYGKILGQGLTWAEAVENAARVWEE